MWEINVGDQFLTFLYSMLLGGILCAFYDILRALRRSGFDSYISVFISDFLFWIINALLTFIFLISRTNGEIRGYVLVAQLLGFVLFRLTLSKLTFPAFNFIIGLTVKIVSRASWLTVVFCDKIEELLSSTTAFIVKIFKKGVKMVKKLLKNGSALLYTKKNNQDLRSAVNGSKTEA